MATYPWIPMGYKSPQFNVTKPAGIMALKDLKSEIDYKQAARKEELSNKVKQTALSAYDQLPDAPPDERMRLYTRAWHEALNSLDASGLTRAAGLSPEDVERARSNIVPPEIARGGLVSLSDVGKREREQKEHEARMTALGNQAREVTRREEKDAAERQKQSEKQKVQQGGQLYFTAFQQAIAQGASDEEADAAGRQALGGQQVSFDPDTMAVTDEGEFIKTGLQQVAKKPPPTMEEVGPLGPAQATGRDYDWRKAYLYNASINPKFNPQTAKTVVDYRTGRVIPNEPVLAASERVAKAGASKVEVGWGKPAENKIQEATIDTEQTVRRLRGMRESFDPKYLTWPRQWSAIWSSLKERAGADLSKEERTKLNEFTSFKRKTLTNINQYIKAITGAAMSEAEAKRITAAMPNMDDSPSEFKSKMMDVLDELEENMRAYGRAMKGGPAAVLEEYEPKKGKSKEDDPLGILK